MFCHLIFAIHINKQHYATSESAEVATNEREHSLLRLVKLFLYSVDILIKQNNESHHVTDAIFTKHIILPKIYLCVLT